MPPLAISKVDLTRLVAITRESIGAAHESAYGDPRRRDAGPALGGRLAEAA